MKINLNSSFLRYIIFGALISSVVITLAFLSLKIVDRVAQVERRENLERFDKPTDIISLFVNNTSKENRADLVNKLTRRSGTISRFEVLLVDSSGQILAPETYPAENIELEDFPNKQEFRKSRMKKHRKRKIFSPLLRPPGPGPGHSPPHLREAPNFKFKLKNSDQFLVFKSSTFEPVPDNRKHFLFSLFALTSALILGIGCTILFMLLSFRKQTTAMDKVIEKLKKGDLKARISVGKIDEYSKTMLRFNNMAEEIESLVNSLRVTEDSRKNLMRELAHDLRTPIASLKNCIEIIKDKSHLLTEDKKNQLIDISLKETEYFSLLVDDLLFLGQVNEPRYKDDYNKVSLDNLIKYEVQNIKDRFSKVNIIFIGNLDSTVFRGDKKLLTRLIRNGLENSCSFAKTRVDVKTELTSDNHIKIFIQDDGPGFDEHSLKDFGKKKYSREITKDDSKRISIGLGSVIMNSITESYRGELRVSNIIVKNQVKGAQLIISLPLA